MRVTERTGGVAPRCLSGVLIDRFSCLICVPPVPVAHRPALGHGHEAYCSHLPWCNVLRDKAKGEAERGLVRGMRQRNMTTKWRGLREMNVAVMTTTCMDLLCVGWWYVSAVLCAAGRPSLNLLEM